MNGKQARTSAVNHHFNHRSPPTNYHQPGFSGGGRDNRAVDSLVEAVVVGSVQWPVVVEIAVGSILAVEALQAYVCLAGDSSAYQRTSVFGDDVVIVAAHRTAICKSKRGGFKYTYADDLLTPVLKAVIEKTNVNPSEVGDIVVGTVLAPGSQRASECRMAAFYAGFPETVPIRTVNRQCSSSLQAVADVAAAIKAGFYDIGPCACGV